MISAILLAAGNSGRMGRPKALLPYKNSTFINHILTNLESAGCSPIVTILGKHSSLILENSRAGQYEYAVNEKPEEGMISSIQLGIKILPENSIGFLLALVDHPAVQQTTYKRMINAALENPDQIIIPEYKGRRGHPVYIGRQFFEQLLNAGAKQTARDIINTNKEIVKYLDIDDPGILTDIDFPEDLKKL